jgi:hypothetical protein
MAESIVQCKAVWPRPSKKPTYMPQSLNHVFNQICGVNACKQVKDALSFLVGRIQQLVAAHRQQVLDQTDAVIIAIVFVYQTVHPLSSTAATNAIPP